MNRNVKLFATLTVMIVSILFTENSQGQRIMSSDKEGGGMGYFMFGGSILDIKSLNTSLKDNGYSGISDNFFSIGGGGHGINNKVIIGGEGHTLIGEEATKGRYETSIEAGYGLFNVGYIVYDTNKLRVYPLLGLGGGGISLKIVERGVSPSFNEVLDDPKRNVTLSTGGFMVNVALGTDYLLQLGEDEEGKGGLVFGFRVGYALTPFKGDWYMEEIEIYGAPELGITGPYIHLMFGGGGFGRKE